MVPVRVMIPPALSALAPAMVSMLVRTPLALSALAPALPTIRARNPPALSVLPHALVLVHAHVREPSLSALHPALPRLHVWETQLFEPLPSALISVVVKARGCLASAPLFLRPPSVAPLATTAVLAPPVFQEHACAIQAFVEMGPRVSPKPLEPALAQEHVMGPPALSALAPAMVSMLVRTPLALSALAPALPTIRARIRRHYRCCLMHWYWFMLMCGSLRYRRCILHCPGFMCGKPISYSSRCRLH
jgi:hypothetical protein